jgi:hypothetical protein
LVAEYVASKRAALASGPTDNIAYNLAKQPVIRKLLAETHAGLPAKRG